MPIQPSRKTERLSISSGSDERFVGLVLYGDWAFEHEHGIWGLKRTFGPDDHEVHERPIDSFRASRTPGLL